MIIHSNLNNNNNNKISSFDLSSFQSTQKVEINDLVNLFRLWSQDDTFRQANENFILNLKGFDFFEPFSISTKRLTQKIITKHNVYKVLDKLPALKEALFSFSKEKSPAYFDISLKETVLYKRAFFDGGSFTNNLLNTGQISQGELAMLVLFHELGHAVHVKYAITNHKSFANFLEPHEQYKKEIIDNINSLHPSWNECTDDGFAHSIEESFADNYSLLMLAQTVGKTRACEIAEIVLKGRKEMSSPEGYLYHNEWGITKLLTELKSMKEPLKDNFKDFDDFYKHLSKIVFYNFTQQLSNYYNTTDSSFDKRNIKLLSRHYLLLKTNTYPTTLHNETLVNEVKAIQSKNSIFSYHHSYLYGNLTNIVAQLKLIDPSIITNNKTKVFHIEPSVYEYAKDNINLEFQNNNKLYFEPINIKDKIQRNREINTNKIVNKLKL